MENKEPKTMKADTFKRPANSDPQWMHDAQFKVDMRTIVLRALEMADYDIEYDGATKLALGRAIKFMNEFLDD